MNKALLVKIIITNNNSVTSIKEVNEVFTRDLLNKISREYNVRITDWSDDRTLGERCFSQNCWVDGRMQKVSLVIK